MKLSRDLKLLLKYTSAVEQLGQFNHLLPLTHRNAIYFIWHGAVAQRRAAVETRERFERGTVPHAKLDGKVAAYTEMIRLLQDRYGRTAWKKKP